MKLFRRYCIALSVCLVSACNATTPIQSGGTNADLADKTPGVLLDRSRLHKHLVESGVLDADRSLVHLSYTCNLTIDNAQFSVLDVRELIKGAMTPRGVNQIVVLNSADQLVQRIEYGQARPLFCDGDKLYLYGDVSVDGQVDEGNVLQFNNGGFDVVVRREDLNSKLPLK